MKSLVTGGAGFIGSHIVDALLTQGDEVTVLDNFSTGRPENLNHIENEMELVEADLSLDGTWANHFKGIDRVFHLAALADIVPSIENPDTYYQANVTGTFNVMKTCKECNVGKVVYSASSSCYGIPDIVPTPESAEIRPQYPYALTKFLGEQIVLHWSNVYGVPSVSTRLFNVYGPRSRTSGTYGAVFGVFLAQKLNKKPFTVVGDGTQTRDFTHVEDVVSALITASESTLEGEIINIGSDNTYSVNRVVELLEGEVVYIPKRPGEPDCTWADISKVKKLLKWYPTVSIEQGIGNLLDNIDYWSKAPVWDADSISIATRKWFEYLG
jgi:UDP-glucose 4-epimerase|tara:strand:+ start:395 stop:1372 length:978 start_codon:yes stop_codon:yes gene_type:complete